MKMLAILETIMGNPLPKDTDLNARNCAAFPKSGRA